jgi:hypothetical protein
MINHLNSGPVQKGRLLKFLKVVTIFATFPEFKSGAMYQRGKGKASTLRAASARALGDLLKQPKVKGKRFSTFTATVSIGKEAVEEGGAE